MSSNAMTIFSTIGKKVLMGVTGLALVGFLFVHLAGNLLLLLPDSKYFNKYTYTLESLGVGLYILEALLAFAFLTHIYAGVSVSIRNRRARPVSYAYSGDAGGVSKKSVASISMIYTGLIMFAFLIWHIAAFKFGASDTVTVDGVAMRDLYGVVERGFSQEWITALYLLVMVLMGVHLRHGFWSAFQSLGASHPRYTPIISAAGIFVAAALAVGFLVIPILVYVRTNFGDPLGGIL